MTARRGLRWFALRRAVHAAVTIWALATIVFIMVKAIPGDEAQVAAGADASRAQVEIVRERLGLDAPVPVQYVRFLGRLLTGDLGRSITTLQPVAADLGRVLPSTIELVLIAMAINLSIAIPAATVAAAKRGGALDSTVRLVAVLAGGIPVFWMALIFQYLFGTVWAILPISGEHNFGYSAREITGMQTVDALISGNLASFIDALRHIVLPAAVLAVMFSSQIFRTLRASLVGVLESDFIVAVRAKGASTARVLFRHALPNALNPVLMLAATQLGIMIGTAVLVETVFARQGVGAYLAQAVAQKDTYAVLGTVLFVGTVVCIVNLAADMLQLALDPRVRSAQMEGGSE